MAEHDVSLARENLPLCWQIVGAFNCRAAEVRASHQRHLEAEAKKRAAKRSRPRTSLQLGVFALAPTFAAVLFRSAINGASS